MAKPRALPQCAFTVGIDPASESFVAALMTALNQDVRAIEEFDNTKAGFAAFEGWLEVQHVPADDLLICLEDTGVYSEALWPLRARLPAGARRALQRAQGLRGWT